MKLRAWLALELLALILVSPTVFAAQVAVVEPPGAGFLTRLAAREIRRYVYLRTGQMPTLLSAVPENQPAILVATRTDSLLTGLLPAEIQSRVSGAGPQEFVIQTIQPQKERIVCIIGGDEAGTLYGAFRFCELLGVRFYLHGDVIPDQRRSAELPQIRESGKPLFDTRGIQPFHDFPEGPDWWDRDDYLSYVSQLAKLRMNFLGFHCYPEGGPHAEPSVWIGHPKDLDQDGKPLFSHPSFWANTQRDKHWGYLPMKTSEFAAGASELFPDDVYGPEVMAGLMPKPGDQTSSNLLFDRTGELFREAFVFARSLGVKTCLGTETPLTVPRLVQKRLEEQGFTPADPQVIRDLYVGIFKRINLIHPLNYYWLWTPEGWTWEGDKPEQFQATVRDVQAALGALDSLGNPFTLATSGWVLGPAHDRAALDKVLPKSIPMSCINRETGHDIVEPGFAGLEGRPKWAIPWMENDPNLVSPQPWVGRMRYDAADARRLGCTGLLGIHWRTKILSGNIAALAWAAWDQSYAPADWRVTSPPRKGPKDKPAKVEIRRTMPVEDFYVDFARANFGDPAAREIGRLLARIDGSNLPEPSHWEKGPGGINIAKVDRSRYGFVEQLEGLRGSVQGVGTLERFDYWLNTYRYMRALAQVGSLRAELDRAMASLDKEKDARKRNKQANAAISVRLRLGRAWETMLSHLIAATDTPGDLGTIANLEQHNRGHNTFLSTHDEKLVRVLGHPLPPESVLSKEYRGPARLAVPTVRSQARTGESLSIRVFAIDREPVKAVVLYWRSMGRGGFVAVPATHVGRAVYQASLPHASSGMEYYLQAETASGRRLTWPVTAPDLCQTVIVLPEGRP
jgi:hypothetical protein